MLRAHLLFKLGTCSLCVHFKTKISWKISWILIRNWVFVTNSNIQTSISLIPNVINLWYFKLIWSNRIHSSKYLRSTTFGSKDIVIRKAEFVAKTRFLFKIHEIFSWNFCFKMYTKRKRTCSQIKWKMCAKHPKILVILYSDKEYFVLHQPYGKLVLAHCLAPNI